MKKALVIGIIFLFIGASIVSGFKTDAMNDSKPLNPRWLYVGGSGPGNYTKIQDAINDSISGDTIYVMRGTYHEALTVNVENLTLIGEERNITIIDTNWTVPVIIEQSYITVCGFTIKGLYHGIYVYDGLTAITVSFNTMNGMFISGINNKILNNTFLNYPDYFYHGYGVYLFGESFLIQGNRFIENIRGIEIGGSEHTVTGNIFIGNKIGLYASGSDILITGNCFENNSLGVLLHSSNTEVRQNNFIQNGKQAKFAERTRGNGNSWENNYWSDFSSLGCKIIFGRLQTSIKRLYQPPYQPHTYYWIPWINIDRNPAQEPYEISE